MSTTVASLTASPSAARRVLSGVRLVLALQFAVGGVMKLTGAPAMVEMFAEIGAGDGLRFFVGACELAGAGGLLTRRLRVPAACGLAALMVGAIATRLLVLGGVPVIEALFCAAAVSVATRTRR